MTWNKLLREHIVYFILARFAGLLLLITEDRLSEDACREKVNKN